MNSVFLCFHTRKKDEDSEDIKLLGVFSTKENAESAVADSKNNPGFCDHKDGFSVSEYSVDERHWLSGFGV